jgi:predicted ester cyclase
LPAEENLEAVDAFFQRVLNAGDMAALDGLSHRDVIVPGSKSGIEGFRGILVEIRGTFAGPEYKVMETISEGEKVVVRYSAKATHSGKYLGLNGTGLRLRLWGIMIFRFEAGGIAEFWHLFDIQGILKQIREADKGLASV